MVFVVEFLKIWVLVFFAIVVLFGAVWVVNKLVDWVGERIQERFGVDAEERWYAVMTVVWASFFVTVFIATAVIHSRG